MFIKIQLKLYKELTKKGYKALFKLINYNETRKPFHVVKVKSEDLQGLWFGHSYNHINERRIGLIADIRKRQVYPHPIA